MPEEISFFSGAVTTIIGVIFGGFVGYISAIKINKRQQFNEAASKFQSAFVETKRLLDKNRLFEIYNNYNDPIFDILSKHIIYIERAKIRFSSFLNKKDLSAFNKAWDEYYSKSQDGSDYYLNDYVCDRCSKTNKVIYESMDEKRELALKRIGHLLDFAARK